MQSLVEQVLQQQFQTSVEMVIVILAYCTSSFSNINSTNRSVDVYTLDPKRQFGDT